MLQGILGHGEVVEPVGGNIHQIDVIALAKLLVALLAVVDVGCRQTGLAQNLVAGLSTIFLIVAEGHDLRTIDVGPPLNSSGPPHAQTHESHAHDF